MKIYVFGNELVDNDSLPLKLLPQLKKNFPKITFVTVDPNENFPPKGEKNLIIFDTVFGIDKPMILNFNDFEKNKNTPISPHDYDLLFHLLLLKKMKKLGKIIIIGVPPKTNHSLFKNILKIITGLS